jgi:hypothetical protein
MRKPIQTALKFLSVAMLAGLWLAGGRANAADEPKPLATGKQDDGLVIEVMEVRPDNHGSLMIRWRYKNPTKEKIELLCETSNVGTLPPGPPNTQAKFWAKTYYVEGKLETATAYHHYNVIEVNSVTKKPTGKRVSKDLGGAAVVIKPGGEFEMWAAFSLPQNRNEKTITLNLARSSQIKNIPIQEKE